MYITYIISYFAENVNRFCKMTHKNLAKIAKKSSFKKKISLKMRKSGRSDRFSNRIIEARFQKDTPP